ncbi:phosphatidylinositol N-acetylglucosaminyltransferase subunit C [Onthophagus taurus]|uniref:phosphatidylinositol N-acetylglucosaminyltransferase subunit C n=1 Tax=Onthophagus taurus TaxID=166361 RepID=UPI0039BE2D51
MVKWKKILYENQGFSDNYTDKTFLKDLRKNVNSQEIALKDCLLGASYLIQELSIVVSFVLIYVFLYNNWLPANTVLLTAIATILLGFVLYRKAIKPETFRSAFTSIRTFIIFFIFAYFFSPVLYTLTVTISTDTIYTSTFYMMLIHLIFFDYGVAAAIVSNSLSISAAMFASICLASRLQSSYHSLVLITIAIECFILSPILRKSYSTYKITPLLILGIIFVLFNICTVCLVLYTFVLIFICLICPMLFRKYQNYKRNIYGPWDEAIIDNAAHINDLIYS